MDLQPKGGLTMKYRMCSLLLPLVLTACATETSFDPYADYEELNSTTILDAPEPMPGNFAPENRFVVERGEYLVELLGCGVCHTDGALEGAPNMERPLAGSRTGIAWMNPPCGHLPNDIHPNEGDARDTCKAILRARERQPPEPYQEPEQQDIDQIGRDRDPVTE